MNTTSDITMDLAERLVSLQHEKDLQGFLMLQTISMTLSIIHVASG
jgi:hypothetical protein